MISDHDRVTGLEPVWDQGGRPSLYDPGFCDLVRRLALLGMPCTMKDLALFFGAARSTIYLWKSQFPEFSDAIEAGRLRADGLVAERMFERAIGFEYIEQQAFKVKRIEYHKNGKEALETEEIKVVEVLKVLPPDLTAGKFWLKNRHPEAGRRCRTGSVCAAGGPAPHACRDRRGAEVRLEPFRRYGGQD